MSIGSAPARLTRADIIPGKILSQPRLMDLREIEDEFQRQYCKASAEFLKLMPSHLQKSGMDKVLDDMKSAPFAFGRRAFNDWALNISTAPFLAWILLRIEHPQTTREEAERLVSDNMGAINGIWDLMGYESGSKKKMTTPASQSPGEASTGSFPAPEGEADTDSLSSKSAS